MREKTKKIRKQKSKSASLTKNLCESPQISFLYVYLEVGKYY